MGLDSSKFCLERLSEILFAQQESAANDPELEDPNVPLLTQSKVTEYCILDDEAIGCLQDDMDNLNNKIEDVMSTKLWDDLHKWKAIRQSIYDILSQLEFCNELQRSFLINTQPSILTQLLTLLTTKGYIEISREPIWRMVKYLIKKGITPISTDMRMIYHEFTHIYNKDGVSICYLDIFEIYVIL